MTDNDVRRALAKDHCDVNDFMALISCLLYTSDAADEL